MGSFTIGALAFVVDVGGRAVNELIESHWVGLPTAVTVAVSVGAFVWWIDGRFEQASKIRNDQVTEISERLSKIEQRLDDLPCDEEDRDVKTRKKKQ